MLNTRALFTAIIIPAVLQIVMVVAGHSDKAIASLFAVLGMAISFVAGLEYAMLARSGGTLALAVGGLIAGAACALIGIVVSYVLHDVPASLLLLGTVSSAVTGAIGGLVGRLITKPERTVA